MISDCSFVVAKASRCRTTMMALVVGYCLLMIGYFYSQTGRAQFVMTPSLLLTLSAGASNRTLALAQPSADSDWRGTTIFNRQHDFVVVGFFNTTLLMTSTIANLVVFEPNSNSNSSSSSNVLFQVCFFNPKTMGGERSSRLDVGRLGCRSFRTFELMSNWFDDFSVMSDDDNQQVSHVFVANPDSGGRDILFAHLDLISPPSNGDNQYFFCFGLADSLADTSMRHTNCPPCICEAVFEAQTLFDQNLEVSPTDLAEVSAAKSDDHFVRANALFKQSRFIPCVPMREEGIQRPGDLFVNGELSKFTSSSGWAVRKLFRNNGMRAGLDSGTLLGWYRNCSVIPGDVDMDFFVPSWDVNVQFYQNILQTVHIRREPVRAQFETSWGGETVALKSTRIFGDLQSGVEVRFEVGPPGVRRGDPRVAGIDVFLLHLNDSDVGYPHTDAFVTWERKIMFYAWPKNLTLCSTIFLRDLYLVPCEPDHLLRMNYGDHWMTPAARIDSAWQKQPNIRKTIQLTPPQWIARRMYMGFE